MKVWALFFLSSNIKRKLILSGLAWLLVGQVALGADFSSLSKAEQENIADLIFCNECSRSVECLVSWNDGENFASLGIGHFIWFPQNSDAPFQESFPDFVRWLHARQVLIPQALTRMLQPNQHCPWQNKADFLKPEHQHDIQALRDFLNNSKSEQAAFIMARLKQSLPKMLHRAVSPAERQHIQSQFARIADSRKGWYVLADYVNFKGEGIKASERYQGQGWGLMQVLLHMQGENIGEEAMHDFTESAAFVLKQRVQLSPPARGETRWLNGWLQRINTYDLPAGAQHGL